MSAGGKHLKDEGSRQQVIIAGGIAGLVSRFCIAPLDVIKIRLQLQVHACRPLRPSAHGAFATAKRIFRGEGITGFWRGNVPAELLYVTYGAVQFTAYRSVSSFFSQTQMPSSASAFASGALAGATATAATYPLDLLRTRFAAQANNRVYATFVGSFLHIAREEGARGFFQGLGAGLGQIIPYMGAFFSVYEGLRPVMADMQLPFGSGDAAAGIMASTIAKTSVFPLDLIRKRLQVQGPARARFAGGVVPEYGRGVWKTGRAIISKEGWLGLYRGLSVSLVKAAPASAVTMWTYERALRELRTLEVLQHVDIWGG